MFLDGRPDLGFNPGSLGALTHPDNPVDMVTSILKKIFRGCSAPELHESDVAQLLLSGRRQLAERLDRGIPRVVVVKQDVNEDLYCCPPNASAAEIVDSTLLRTGPVALFSDLNADFLIVRTEDDPECSVWKERATVLKWDSLEFFASYQSKIPGREFGQSSLAVSVDDVDWGQYDIVVSMDVCVPSRIALQHPKTLWCYYIREIKAPAYKASLTAAMPGYNRVLNHHFRLNHSTLPAHVLEFPYHLQYYGCFHQLFGWKLPEQAERQGVFADHHTMLRLSPEGRAELRLFGWLASTIHEGDREVIPSSERLARRTMDPDLKARLLNSRFFLITPGQRSVFGTALIESIAAGCLAIGRPEAFRSHGYLFSDATSAASTNEAIEKMKRLSDDPDLLHKEIARQRTLIDFVCFVRPLLDLIQALDLKKSAVSRWP